MAYMKSRAIHIEFRKSRITIVSNWYHDRCFRE